MDGRTTTSIQGMPSFDASSDPTPGLCLVYSKVHRHLPSALPFAATVLTIGRDSSNTLCIPEAAVSRFHARVERREDGWWLLDAGSTNGTFVNGQKTAAQALSEHDIVRIGDTVFRHVSERIYSYSAYRIDGTVVEETRPAHHNIPSPALIGGFQVDALLEQLTKVAISNISVVVTGESGTGKELVARELHKASGRGGAFQAVNCAALPANLIESELFGYRRGAFSGANSDKVGLVKAAHRGTLFLDEIGDMPLEAQSKLLRVLQEREVLPIGATTAEQVDVRVVCATHRDLDKHVENGAFRGDLLARLREFTTRLPPLRQRMEDLYPLVLHFLETADAPNVRVSVPFMLALAHHDWPYNVRELESVIKVASTLCGGEELDARHLPEGLRDAMAQLRGGEQSSTSKGRAPTLPRQPAVSEPIEAPPQRRLRRGESPSEGELRSLLERHRGNIAAVGRELGKERMQVHRWLKRFDISIDEYRS